MSEFLPWDGEIRAFRTVRGHDPTLLRVSAQGTLFQGPVRAPSLRSSGCSAGPGQARPVPEVGAGVWQGSELSLGPIRE